MLISTNINAAINKQIGNEFSASMQYVAIASYLASERLVELARFFYTQAEEEREHAMKFVKYLVDSGAFVDIPALPAPKTTFRNVEEAVQLSLDWEKDVTKQINSLTTLAGQESDHITENFLAWFLEEQLEEFTTMDTLLKVAQRAGPNVLMVEEFVGRNRDKLGPATK